MSVTKSRWIDSEALDLLRENSDYFSFLPELHEKGEIPEELRIKVRDTFIETSDDPVIYPDLEPGDKQVRFIYNLDDNKNPEDGYLEMSDSFVFNASENILKKFTRSFSSLEANPKIVKYLESLQAATREKGLTAQSEAVRQFAFSAALAYRRPLNDENDELRGDIKAVYLAHQEVLMEAGEKAQSADPSWALRLADSENYYSFGKGEEGLHFSLYMAVDKDADPTNGRILFRNTFYLNPENLEPLNLLQAWELDPQSERSDNSFSREIKKLNQGEYRLTPSVKSFVKDLLAVLKRPAPQIDRVHQELYLAACEQMDLGEYANAVLSIDSYIESAPWDPEGYSFRAVVEMILGRFQESAEDFSKVIQLDPNRPNAYFGLGSVLFYLEEYLNAEKNFFRAIELSPQTSWDYALLGANQLKLGKVAEALQYLDQALLEEPTSPQSLFYRAQARFELELPGLAIEDLSQIITQGLEDPEVYFLRGQCFTNLGENERAWADFNRAVLLDPDKAEYFYHRARSDSSPNRAGLDLDLAASLKPNDEEIRLERARNKIIEYDYAEARDDLGVVLSKNPEHAEAHFLLGWVEAKLGNPSQALEAYQVALELGIPPELVYKHTGKLRLEMEKPAEALVDFNQLLQAAPNDPDILYQRGLAFYKMEKYAEAKNEFQKVLDLSGITYSSGGLFYYLSMSKIYE